MIAAIIPTLNAHLSLGATLAALGQKGGEILDEIIIADGGSHDGTLDIARRAGCRIVDAPRGRGEQLRRGARQASAPWLLFLHADTCLAAGWADAARRFISQTGTSHRAAAFTFRLDDEARSARVLERAVAFRVNALGLPYGDQGLLIARQFYDAVGGFGSLPIMEDVDLVRRVGRKRMETLSVPAVTSAARYKRDGYAARVLRNATCLGLYFAGVSPRRVARLYG